MLEGPNITKKERPAGAKFPATVRAVSEKELEHPTIQELNCPSQLENSMAMTSNAFWTLKIPLLNKLVRS